MKNINTTATRNYSDRINEMKEQLEKVMAIYDVLDSADKPMTAEEISEACGITVTKESLLNYYRNAGSCYPTFPNLCLKEKRITRYFVECDEDGNPISNMTTTKEGTEYRFYFA